MFRKIFISHAKEDYQIAENLYNFLEIEGYEPWLDKKKLRLGANWDYEILNALEDSDFVILLLSSTSVKKRGYVQKEFKIAVDYSQNKLIDDLYILPILVDKCEVPKNLSQFQWKNFEGGKIQDEILDSINLQRKKYLDELSVSEIELNEYHTYSIPLNLKIDIYYKCSIPFFHKNQYFDSDIVNTSIKQKAIEAINDFKILLMDNEITIDEDHTLFTIDHRVTKIDDSGLSIILYFSSFCGGIHPNNFIETLNFTFNPTLIISFEQYIKSFDLKKLALNAIKKIGVDEQKQSLPYYVRFITKHNFHYTEDKSHITLYFTNLLPRILIAIGDIKIPKSEFNLLLQEYH